MSLDETRMSISSDDFNRSISSSSVTNVPIKKGNNAKKCIFGIVIVGCLLLSILIALDVISIKKIMGTNQENKINLQVKNQLNQEENIKRENQEMLHKKKKKRIKKRIKKIIKKKKRRRKKKIIKRKIRRRIKRKIKKKKRKRKKRIKIRMKVKKRKKKIIKKKKKKRKRKKKVKIIKKKIEKKIK